MNIKECYSNMKQYVNVAEAKIRSYTYEEKHDEVFEQIKLSTNKTLL